MEALIQDLHYALRMLRRSPGFATVAVLSLALGIGANTAVFSLINALLLRRLPVQKPEELVVVEAQQKGKWGLLSFPMYRDLRERQQVFTDILASAGETPVRITIPSAGGQGAELDNMRVSFVTGNYFSVLGVQPVLGRFFSKEEDSNPESSETTGSVVVLSYGFWERQFGRDAQILGRKILIGRSHCQIIGVAPQGFFGEAVGSDPVAWLPLIPFSSPDNLENRRGTFTSYMARVKSGVSRGQAQSAMTVLFQQLLAAEGRIRDRIEENTIALDAGDIGFDYGLRRTFAKPLWIVMAIVALVLLIACANVANLLLARAALRRGEIGVRMAIGCSRLRLVGQLVTESLLLSMLGTVAGVVLAYWSSRSLARTIGANLDLSPDLHVLIFLCAAGLLTGLGFGLVPALQATRVDPAPALKGAHAGENRRPTRQRLSRALVTAQVALSLLLLIAAGLLIRSLRNLHQLDLGFRPQHVLLFDLAHNPQNRAPSVLAQVAWQVHQRVKQVPGVESVSLSSLLLFSPSDIGAPLKVRDYIASPGERINVRFNSVSPGYFQTVGMSLIEGRDILDQDNQNAPLVAVINEAMARRYFLQGKAIGRIMEINLGPASLKSASPLSIAGKPIEIVGVIRNAKYNNLREDPKPMFYLPIAQSPRSLRSLEVRTSWPLAAMAGPVQRALAEINKDVMVRRVISLSDKVDQSLAGERLIMNLCSIFGALALLLACVGLYGVMAYSVAQRTGEIGIRMALGAQRSNVLWMVLQETLTLVVIGVGIGIPAALAATRLASSLISGLLFGLKATDPVTIAAAALLLASVALIAGYLPARRASKVDPMVALRYE